MPGKRRDDQQVEILRAIRNEMKALNAPDRRTRDGRRYLSTGSPSSLRDRRLS